MSARCCHDPPALPAASEPRGCFCQRFAGQRRCRLICACGEWPEGKPCEYLTEGCRRWQELRVSPSAVKVIAVLAAAGHRGSRGAESSLRCPCN